METNITMRLLSLSLSSHTQSYSIFFILSPSLILILSLSLSFLFSLSLALYLPLPSSLFLSVFLSLQARVHATHLQKFSCLSDSQPGTAKIELAKINVTNATL